MSDVISTVRLRCVFFCQRATGCDPTNLVRPDEFGAPRPRRARTFFATRDPCDPATLPTLAGAGRAQKLRPGCGGGRRVTVPAAEYAGREGTRRGGGTAMAGPGRRPMTCRRPGLLRERRAARAGRNGSGGGCKSVGGWGRRPAEAGVCRSPRRRRRRRRRRRQRQRRRTRRGQRGVGRRRSGRHARRGRP